MTERLKGNINLLLYLQFTCFQSQTVWNGALILFKMELLANTHTQYGMCVDFFLYIF